MSRVAWRLLVAVLVLAGCSDDDEPTPSPELEDYIAGVTLTTAYVFPSEPTPLTVSAVRRSGTPPEEDLGPSGFGCPMLRTQIDHPVGTTLTCETGAFARASPLTTFYVWVGDVPGYWEVTLPEPLGSLAYGVSLIYDVQLAPDAPEGPFYLRTSGTDVAGHTGVTTNERVVLHPDIPPPENPDVEVVLTWTGASDLDVHVVDPFGHDVSVFAPNTPEGAVFSGDSNGACTIDDINRETITWPGAKAPAGEYHVYIVYFDDCGQEGSSYTVSVNVAGAERAVEGGTFTGAANPSDQRDVTTFTFP